MNFTKEQKAIFEFVEKKDGHGIIDAVAGAGKTFTIIESAKFANNKSDVLFCAFNRSIANEIAKKFSEKGLSLVTVKTIHALGKQVLISSGIINHDDKVENKKYKMILSKNDQVKDLLSEHYENLISINKLISNDDHQKFAIKNLIYNFNERLIDINQKYRATLTKGNIEEFKQLLIHFGLFNSIEISSKNFGEELKIYYEAHKILLNVGNELALDNRIIDFTDMLYLPVEWNLSPTKRYSFLFVDECQDLSKSQLAIVTKHCKRNGRILAVGDPKQSIYGFTGADIESFERVRNFTKAHPLPLTKCFRCPQKVIEIAKTIREDISSNTDEEGEVINISIEEVYKLAKPNDLIISRLKAPLVVLIFGFIDRNTKVQIHKDEVEDFINELKHLFKQDELNNKLNETFEPLKDKVIARWEWIINQNAKNIIDVNVRNLYVSNEFEYVKKKLDFLHKKHELWKSDCSNIFAILKKIKEFISAEKNSIKISTIHRAKGLENDRVFIINYNELPFNRIGQKEWEKTQEVNLKYVAVTRAKKELFLVKSAKIKDIEDEGSLFDDLPF